MSEPETFYEFSVLLNYPAALKNAEELGDAIIDLLIGGWPDLDPALSGGPIKIDEDGKETRL